MEKLACLGLLDPGCKTENVYVQLLETINKKEFTARSITVTIVDALSDIVYVAKSKTDKAPKTLLTKRQFAHVLGYICNRDLTLGEVQDSVVRNVWNPRKMEKQLATNPNALWDGVKFFGVKTTQLLTHGSIIFYILEQSSFQNYTTWWVFPELCHMLYLCICVFV